MFDHFILPRKHLSTCVACWLKGRWLKHGIIPSLTHRSSFIGKWAYFNDVIPASNFIMLHNRAFCYGEIIIIVMSYWCHAAPYEVNYFPITTFPELVYFFYIFNTFVKLIKQRIILRIHLIQMEGYEHPWRKSLPVITYISADRQSFLNFFCSLSKAKNVKCIAFCVNEPKAEALLLTGTKCWKALEAPFQNVN